MISYVISYDKVVNWGNCYKNRENMLIEIDFFFNKFF